MSKKLLQYYQGKMQTGGKVLPLYAEGDPIPSRYAPIPRAASDMRVQMPVIARTAAEARAARAFNNGTIRPAKSQNRFAKALAIAANPATAASYAVKGQPIPDNFDRAETNRYDIATSVANPFSYLKQVVDTKRELEEGNYGSAALNAMGILPTRLPNFGRITSANLDGFLGKQLNNVNRKMEHLRGKNNEGVFMMRDRDDIVIKLEDANRTAHFTDTPEFAHTNMAEKMRDIPDNLPISKTLYQLDDLRLKNYQAPMRASFMKRVTGVPGGQLAPSQFVKIPDKSYQELYSNLKTLRNNDLAFDYFGNNYLYNPNTQQFGLFDIGLQPKNRGYWADDVYGASSKELFGLDTSGKNIKEAIREKMSGDFRYTMEPEYDAFYDGASKLSIADLQAITAEGSRRISQRVKDALANMNYYAEGGPIDPPYPIRGQVIPRATTDNTRVAPSDVVFYTDQGYQYAQSQYKRAKEFHEKWMNSPMYNRMIQKSDPTQAEDITKRRKKNMEGVKFKFVSVQPKNNPNTGGFSNSVTGDVTILPRGLDVHGMGTHELSHSIDRPSKGTIMLQGLKNLIFNDDDETVIDTWNKSRLMPTNDINTISKMAGRNQSIYTKQNTSKEDKEWFEYVTNPTETRARLNDIRQSAYESGLYDPFKEAVTPAIYNELRDHRYEKGKNRGFDAMRQLRGVYTDQQILNLLNSVSKTNKPPTEVENYMMSIGGPVDPPVKDNTSARIKVIPTAEQLKYNRMQNQIARMPKKEAFVQSPGISPEGYGRRMYDKAEAEKRMNRILYAADAATDVMQVGNFIPFPAAQFIGKVGNMLGSGVDAFQSGVEARKGNVGSSAINYASGILPSVIKDPAVLGGYRRSAKYSFGNRSFYNPVDKRYGRMTSKQLMGNRALLGALGAETVYDAYQDGGLLTRTISCSNCGHSWKAVDGGIDPMNCHKCGGLVKMAKGGMTDGPGPRTVYVSSPNDPRLKKYADSLNAYNAGEDAYKFGKNIYNLVRSPKNNEFRNNYNIRRVSTKERSPFMDTNIYPVESYSETYDRKPGSFWEQNVKDKRPNYYIGNNGEHWEPTGTGWSRFKKPVQPVEYRPQPDQFGLTGEDYKKAFGSDRKGFISTPGNKLGDGYYKYKKGNETYKIYSRSGGLNWVEKEKPTAKAKPVVAQPQIVRAQQPVAPVQPVQPTQPAYRMQGTTPVYGPSNSLIGMMNQQSGEFYPDYMNTAARARVNQEDTDMIGNQEKILQYLRAYGMSNPKVIPQKKDGGQMIKRADGSYSRRGLWDNVRANTGSGKKPTAQMLEQERKIKAKNK
jgi:hypothetical protein